MLNISYNISPRLQEYLNKIESLRKQILLTPIPPRRQLQFRWQATFNRIHYSLKLAGNSLKKTEMEKLLSEITHNNISKEQKEVLDYKQALDHITQNWQGSPNAVKTDDLINLYKIIGSGSLRVPKAGLQALLDYVQASKESPIIQAAIIIIELEKMRLFTQNNSLISHLAADLFLYKYGYDLQGFLAYEAAWMEDVGKFKENHMHALGSSSLTLWLEYFAQNILKQSETIAELVNKPDSKTAEFKNSVWELNERQKSILNLLDSPLTTITNRQIQKKFKISQITASRDLAKLTNLGCLFSHGKGRSIYYTRIPNGK